MPGYPCRSCCVESCWTGSDNFDRTNSTDLGSDWHEEVGYWENVNGDLHELSGSSTGTANAKIYFTQAVPINSAGEMQVNIKVISPHINDIFYIYLACNDIHGAGGSWASFEYTAVNTWKVTLSTGEWKIQTYIPPLNTPYTHIFRACIDSDGFLMAAVSSSGDEYPWNDGAATGSGRYCGLGHNNTAYGALLDDFSVYSLRTATEECVTCFCHCGDFNDRNNIQKGLLLTVFNAVNRATCMGGLSVGLDWEWNSGIQRWLNSTALRVNSTNSTKYSEFKWIFRCGSHNPADPFAHFSLEWHPDYIDCCHGNVSTGCETVFQPLPDVSTCSTALSLVFGPFKLSKGELSCNACYDAGYPLLDPTSLFSIGEYYIAITEST